MASVKKLPYVIPDNSFLSWHAYAGDNGGCGHIRIIFPTLLTNIYRPQKKVQIVPSYGMHFIMDERFYQSKLFIILQRVASEKHLTVVRHLKNDIFKKTETKIIYEIDDDLIDIPEWNHAAGYFNTNRKITSEIIKLCDGVTTSTEHLAKKLRKINKRVSVVPNHLPKFLWGDIQQPRDENNKKPRILWAGSSNHFAVQNSGLTGGDFDTELIAFIKKTVDIYTWVFIGALPVELIEIIDKIEYHPWKNIFEYPQFLKQMKIDLAVAPLIDHDFNRSKSNIKSLEYTVCGFPSIYKNITPYEDLVMTYDTGEELVEKIEHAIKNVDFRINAWQNDLDILKEQLYWEEYDNVKKYIQTNLEFFNIVL